MKRIGPPPPEDPPFVIHRLTQKQLLTMSSAELEDHLQTIYRVGEVMVVYNEAVRDVLAIRKDIEAAAENMRKRHEAACVRPRTGDVSA